MSEIVVGDSHRSSGLLGSHDLEERNASVGAEDLFFSDVQLVVVAPFKLDRISIPLGVALELSDSEGLAWFERDEGGRR